jgi:hypothetical protein
MTILEHVNKKKESALMCLFGFLMIELLSCMWYFSNLKTKLVYSLHYKFVADRISLITVLGD